jgi:DNA-binding GntR family transcriptional regulator
VPLPDTPDFTLPDESTVDIAFDTILQGILDGTLTAGELLSEAFLSRWLGVSRNPLRAALHRLSSLGIVVMAAGRSARVAPDSPQRQNELLFALFTVGAHDLAAHGGAAGGTLPDSRALQHEVGELKRAQSAGDRVAAARHLVDYFRLLISPSDAAVLTAYVATDLRPGLLRFFDPARSPVPFDQLTDALSTVADDLQSGRPDLAAERLNAIRDATAAAFRQLFRPAQGLPGPLQLS